MEEEEEANPFSFKAFIKRGEGPPASAQQTAAGGVATKNSAARRKGSSKKTQSEDLPFPEEDDVGV